MTFVFNRHQKDALAKNLDNIAVALTIVIVLGVFVDTKLILLNGIALGFLSVLFFGHAVYLRRGDQ